MRNTSPTKRRKISIVRFLVLEALIALTAGIYSPVFAQTASQITPQTFRPNIERQGNIVVPGATEVAAPPGADKLFVKLSGVIVEGGLPQLAQATAILEAKLTGHRISGAEIFAASHYLEVAYAAAGFVLVRVVLPPQKLIDGSHLRLVVIDGFVERVDVDQVPERVRARVSKLLSPLIGKRSLTLRELERRLLIAGDAPGVTLRSTLTAGQGVGATILIIEAKYQAASEIFTYDNTLSAALGRSTLGAGIDLNSVLGLGEFFYLRAGGYPEGGQNASVFDVYPRNRTLAGGLVLPLWVEGLTFNAEYTDARTTPRAVAGIATTDTFDRLSLRLRYAWLRGRMANFYSEVSFDAQDELQSLFVATDVLPLSLDRLRIIRFTNDGDVFTSWGASISARLTSSFGIFGAGARTSADATVLLPLSRQGADAEFQKLNLSLSYSQLLADHFAMAVIAQGQYSFNKPLLHSEQFGIANVSGLSAFDAGSIVGDQGFVLRSEASSPWNLPLPTLPSMVPTSATIAPYVYGAYGEVFLISPNILEAAHTCATSFGAGLHFSGVAVGGNSNGSLTLEYGHAHRNDGIRGGDRFTAVSAFKF